MTLTEVIKLINEKKYEINNSFDPEYIKQLKQEIEELDDAIISSIINADSIYIVYHEKTHAPYIDDKDNIWVFTEYKFAKNITSYSKRKGIDLYIKEISKTNTPNYWAEHLFFNGFDSILLNNGKNPYLINAKKFYSISNKEVLENSDLVYYYLNYIQEKNNPDVTNKKIKLKTLSDNIIDEMKVGKFLLPLKEDKIEEELEEIPLDAIPFVEKNSFKLLPLFTDWNKFLRAFPDGYVGIILTIKEIINLLLTNEDIFTILLNKKYYEYEMDYTIISQLVTDQTRSIHLVRSMHINEDIQKAIKNTPNTAHRVSQPVIYKEGNKYFLASFIFFYTRSDIKMGVIDRPLKWIKMDIETGKILAVHDCKKLDFSDAEFGKTYEVKISREYDTSQYYYENTFALLDEIRMQILNHDKIDKLKYMLYIERILTSIPDSYQRFYFDLSIPCNKNTSGYLMPSDTYSIFEYIEKYKTAVEENTEMKFVVGLIKDYKINNDNSQYSDWSDPAMLLEYVYYPLYLIGDFDISKRLKDLLTKFINSEVPLAFLQAINFIKSECILEKKYKTLPFTLKDESFMNLIKRRLDENKKVLLEYTPEKSGKHFKESSLYEECELLIEDIENM